MRAPRSLSLVGLAALLAVAVPAAAMPATPVEVTTPCGDLRPLCWEPWVRLTPEEGVACLHSDRPGECFVIICTADLPPSLCASPFVQFGFR